jgi:hypothetical protein
VVRSTGVEVPAVDLVIIGAFAEEGMGAWFVETQPMQKGESLDLSPPSLLLVAAQCTRAPGTGQQHPPLFARRKPAHRGVGEGGSPWPSAR